jgi:peptide/nickel transport system substrate-binding protein
MTKAALAAMLLAGTALAPTAPQAQTPRDTIVMGMTIDDLISLDPAEAFEFTGGEVLANTYDRLLIADPERKGELSPRLATSWTVSEDGLTYTFKIRQGVKFHSGNPVTAADAAYSLQRAVTLNKTPAFILTQFGLNKDTAKDAIKAVDAETLTVKIGRAVAPSFFLSCMTATVATVVDSKLLMQNEKDGDFGHAWLRTNSAGSGAYRMRGWRPSESVTLEANADWWRGQPKSRRVILRHIPESQARRLGVEKGDFDIVRDLTKDQIAAVASHPGIKTTQGDRGYITYLAVNTKHPVLGKPEVWAALKLAVDYVGIERDLVRGTHKPHQSFLPAGFLGALTDLPFTLDLAKARETLAKAGVSNLAFTMDVRSRQPEIDIAQSIQSTFAQVGVKVDILQGDARQVLTKYRARNHDALIAAWGPDYYDPHTNAETFAMNEDNSDNARSKTLAWRNGWDIPELTKRTAAAVVERDTAKREVTYQQLQRDHRANSPFIPLIQTVEIVVMRNNVNGFVIGGTYGSSLYDKIVKN